MAVFPAFEALAAPPAPANPAGAGAGEEPLPEEDPNTGLYGNAAHNLAQRVFVAEAHGLALAYRFLESEGKLPLIAEQLRNPPPEGVYVSGLSLDGAIWDKSSASLAEAKPKVLFCEMPILFVTAVSKTAKKSGDLGPFGGFSCPVYKYVRRTDRYIIFSVNLPTQQKPDHWILRGVALLCFTS